MKTILSLILASLFLFSQTGMAQIPLTVSASVPDATGISLTITPVNATTNVFGTPTTTSTTGTLPFNTLTYNSANQIYLPSIYYAVDINTTGGAGVPLVSVTYAEGTNLNNPGSNVNGLGTKATATFATEVFKTATSTTETIPATPGKQRLVDLTGTVGQLPVSSIPSSGWERVYVGIWTGAAASGTAPDQAPADPTNGKPFSNTDVGGTYTGTLTFTAVTL